MIPTEKIENTADGHQWHITEKEAKGAGLSLQKDDGSAGEWGHLWNTGRYVFQGKTVTLKEARALLKFAQKTKRPARSLGEAIGAGK
ncbi:MAG: hypothetical protein IJ521_08065 [Schwartzia sp.]|nr:hypothetical protein [Schwartzia sp. (in: firmicutes)]